MVVIVTKEKVNVPNDLCATYGQLNRLSNQGLMILNTSIVEPGYKGPLSCVLVNFSSQRHALSQDESVAKLNFHKLSGAPSKPYPTSYDHNEYEKNAAKSATKLPKSLLDITGIEERITEKVGSTVRSRIILSGIIIAFLLLWSQLEGFFSGWIYQKTGIMTTKTQVELLLKQQQLDNQKENQQLREKIDGLEKRIADQDAAKKDRRSRQQ